MKATIKSTGKVVEVISRFMPKKRNIPSRDWVCNLSDGTCIDENQLEYIDAPEGLEEAAEKAYPIDICGYSVECRVGATPKLLDYHERERKAFIAGAEWQKSQMLKDAIPFYEILKVVPPLERENTRIIIIKED